MGLLSFSLIHVFVPSFNHGIAIMSRLKPLRFFTKTAGVLQLPIKQRFALENIRYPFGQYSVFYCLALLAYGRTCAKNQYFVNQPV
jgi:hypothetical protein